MANFVCRAPSHSGIVHPDVTLDHGRYVSEVEAESYP